MDFHEKGQQLYLNYDLAAYHVRAANMWQTKHIVCLSLDIRVGSTFCYFGPTTGVNGDFQLAIGIYFIFIERMSYTHS